MFKFLQIFLLIMLFASSSFAGQIEITADDSLEWHREEKIYYAKGNATAIDEDKEITADELYAYYTEKKEGNLNIWKLEGKGKVLIVNNGTKIFGENATYNIDSGSFVVTGDKVSAVSEDYSIRSNKQIEYFEKDNKVIATGKVEVNYEDDIMYSDIVTAYLEDVKNQKQISEIYATGNVTIITPTDVVTADKVKYNAVKETAQADRNVTISRDNSVITGNRANIDMKTGIAKMISNGDKKRVKAIFLSEGE